MNTIKHVLLKGNERFLDHTKSVALYGKLYWRKSDKKLNVGDIVYLFMSGKGHYQIRYNQHKRTKTRRKMLVGSICS